MPERIIDQLESIQIDRQQRSRILVFEALLKALTKTTTVQQAGKIVMEGKMLESALALTPLGNVVNLTTKFDTARPLPDR